MFTWKKTKPTQKPSKNVDKPKRTPSPYQVLNYTTDDELLYPVPTDPSTCNPYEQLGPYRDLNLMFSRGMTRVSTDGRRRVCMGRGYTFCDSPEPRHDKSFTRRSEVTPKNPASPSHCSNDDIKTAANPITVSETESTNSSKKHQKGSETSDDGIAESWFISRDNFEKVTIVRREEDGLYWVLKMGNADERDELRGKLKKRARATTHVKPYVNLKCICKFNGRWFRVSIQEIHEKSMKVFLLDFGIFDDIPVNKVTPIGDFENVPSYFSRKISTVENSDPKFMHLRRGDVINAKAVALDERTGAIVVEVVDEAPEQLSPRERTARNLAFLPNVIDTLTVGQTGWIKRQARLARNELSVCVVSKRLKPEFDALAKDFAFDSALQVDRYPYYEPAIGKYVCGQEKTGKWLRGKVISLDPVKVAAVDEARVFVPVRCARLPKGYNNTTFGLKLTANAELATGDLTFKVLKIDLGVPSAVVSLTSKETGYKGKATLTKWTPRSEQIGVQSAEILIGNQVRIVYALSQNVIYAQGVKPQEVARRQCLEQKITECALNRKALRDLPVVGQIVLAVDENDGKYYRAFVTRIESENVIQIKYVDYGNDAIVTFEQVFDLPDELKEERSCVARIKLRGVKENIPMTEAATSYLTELIVDEVAMECTFISHSPTFDVVVLRTLRKEVFNDLLACFLKPSWQQDEKAEPKEIFAMKQLPRLKIGDVGDQVQAVVLRYYDTPVPTVILAPDNEVAVRAIHGDMLERIQEYVENTLDRHTPSEQELCIALHEGAYRRGVCLSSNASSGESRIAFIDYGTSEVVEHKDIRRMTKDFASFGPLATRCSLSPTVADEKVTPEISKRLSEFLPVNELIALEIISEDDKDRLLHIDIPEARVKLIGEKLL